MPLEPTPRSFPFGSLPLGFKDHAFNAPTQQLLDRFYGPVFEPFRTLILRPGSPEIRADKPVLRCRNRLAE
jgi:hypothetical protein